MNSYILFHTNHSFKNGHMSHGDCPMAHFRIGMMAPSIPVEKETREQPLVSFYSGLLLASVEFL